MNSMFERVNKNMIKNLGGKDLRPVRCMLDATKFRQYSILRRKSRSWFWEQPDDIPVEYYLTDILEPSSSVPESVVSGLFCITDFEVKKVTGGVGVSAGVEAHVTGEFLQSHRSTLEIQSIRIPNPKLEILQNRKLLDPEPSFLNVCRRRGDKLYVVTEAVVLAKETVLSDNSSVNASGTLSIPQVTYVKVEGQGQYQTASARTLTVPQDTVLAYRKKQLVIKGKECAILVFDDTKQKTFQDGSLISPMSPILPVGRIEKPVGQDFRLLQEEVSQNLTTLAHLSKDAQHVVFRSILAMLGDRGALMKLMDMLDLDSVGHLDGPGGKILNELRQDSVPPWLNLQNHILYFLDAFMVMKDIQLVLLAQSAEKRILLHQRELVRSILEPNFKYPWNIPFTLQSQLLAPLEEEGLHITYALLEECGLKMELKRPRSTWHLEAKMPLSALYGALSLLQQLAEA